MQLNQFVTHHEIKILDELLRGLAVYEKIKHKGLQAQNSQPF